MSRITFGKNELFENSQEFVTYCNFIRRLSLLHSYNVKIIGFRIPEISDIFENSSSIVQDTIDVYGCLTDLTFKNIGMQENETLVINCSSGLSSDIKEDGKVSCNQSVRIFDRLSDGDIEVVLGNFNGFHDVNTNREILMSIGDGFIPVSSMHRPLKIKYEYDDVKGELSIPSDVLRELALEGVDKLQKLASITKD